jgi:hypothetical protein
VAKKGVRLSGRLGCYQLCISWGRRPDVIEYLSQQGEQVQRRNYDTTHHDTTGNSEAALQGHESHDCNAFAAAVVRD